MDPNGFSGIDGIFRLKPGGLNERGLTVQEVTRARSREISRPPRSFVEHDRRLEAAMSLAEALRRSNPDRALPNGDGDEDEDGDGVDGQILPTEEAPGAARLSPVAFTPAPLSQQ